MTGLNLKDFNFVETKQNGHSRERPDSVANLSERRTQADCCANVNGSSRLIERSLFVYLSRWLDLPPPFYTPEPEKWRCTEIPE